MTEWRKVRKKPVVVEAWGPWLGLLSASAPPEGVGLDGGDDRCMRCGHEMSGHLTVPTHEGVMWACYGDYIIRGVRGELYPCKPDVFEATYEVPMPLDIEVDGDLAEVTMSVKDEAALADGEWLSDETLREEVIEEAARTSWFNSGVLAKKVAEALREQLSRSDMELLEKVLEKYGEVNYDLGAEAAAEE